MSPLYQSLVSLAKQSASCLYCLHLLPSPVFHPGGLFVLSYCPKRQAFWGLCVVAFRSRRNYAWQCIAVDAMVHAFRQLNGVYIWTWISVVHMLPEVVTRPLLCVANPLGMLDCFATVRLRN